MRALQWAGRLIFAFNQLNDLGARRRSATLQLWSRLMYGWHVQTWHQLGVVPLPPPGGDYAAAQVAPHDGFADPPALVVRDDVLAALGGPERVRAGGLADLVARIEAAGHRVESRSLPVAPRRARPAALLREGSGRLWLFRRHPARHPLPRPRDVGVARWLVLAVGALRANAFR